MPDSRFYKFENKIALRDIGARFSLSVPANALDICLDGFGAIDVAKEGEMAFFDQNPNAKIQTLASVVLVRENNVKFVPENSIAIVCENPRVCFSQIAEYLCKPISGNYSAAPTLCENDVKISPNCAFGENTEIGQGTFIAPNVVIGAGVTIGRNCHIGAGVSIECAYIGDNVIIGANSVIGKAGFGVVLGEKPKDIAHFGRVIIQDNVTIGAICSIDRGLFGDTIIGMNSKLDNHCHIAHNVKMGQGVVIAAYGGISGSVEIADFVIMGGRVGISDHIKIGEKAIISAGSIVSKNVPSGENWGGYPAKPKMQWLKEAVKIEKLTKNGNK